MELVSKLRQRAAKDDPIRIGIVGCGQIGRRVARLIVEDNELPGGLEPAT